jgi:putative transposase
LRLRSNPTYNIRPASSARGLCHDERSLLAEEATFMRFTREFDEVFRSEGIRVIKAPVRAPRARAHAERWVGSLRRECLDRLLIVGRRHLERVVAVYTLHYNEHRPHRSLDQRPPLSQPPPSTDQATADVIELGRIRRRDRLGGLIHEYQLAA